MIDASRSHDGPLAAAEGAALPSTPTEAFSHPQVYRELRRLARRSLSQGARGNTLNTTDLVHEAFLKLRQSSSAGAESYAHFLAIAAMAMRQIVCDFARKRLRDRQRTERVDADDLERHSEATQLDEYREAQLLIRVDEALRTLAASSPRRAQIVTCRYFAGLSEGETALVAGCSERTVQREWHAAREWLRGEVGP